MKRIFLFISLISLLDFCFSQNQLVSYFNSYSEVYEGMEDGGVSRTESYYFKVNATIKLLDIYYNNENLILKKGDTLVINVHSFTSYNSTKVTHDDELRKHELKSEPEPLEFEVRQVNRYYYANVSQMSVWNGVINFEFKKVKYYARAKAGFDAGNTGYAP